MASKSKRIVALVLTAMMATTALAGCSGGGDEEEPIPTPVASGSTSEKVDLSNEETLKFIKDQMAQEASKAGGTIELKMWCSSDDRDFEKGLAEDFKTKFSDSRYTINIKTITKGEADAGGAVIEAPKKAADVFSFADDQLSSLLKAGAIAEVAPYYANNVKAENGDDAITVSSSNNKLYAFPKTSDNGYFLYYDKRIFSDADVADMDTMVKKAAEKGKSVYFNMGNAWYETGFFFAAGCTIKYENGTQTATLGTPEGLNAAKAMCHIAESEGKGFSGSPGQIGDNAYVAQGFDEGSLAAAVIGTWMGPAIKKAIGAENVGAAKLPTVLMDGKQVQLHSFGGYKLLGVNVFSEFSFSAQTLAYFLGSEASQVKRYETRGLIPTNSVAAQKDTIKTDPAFKAIEDQKAFAHPQGSSVSGVYWGSGVASIGGDIVTAKGAISDTDLQNKLKAVQDNMHV